MTLNAVVIDREFEIISDDFIIDDDNFEVIETAAKSLKGAIRWSRSSDGNVAYWTPGGASFEPHFYSA